MSSVAEFSRRLFWAFANTSLALGWSRCLLLCFSCYWSGAEEGHQTLCHWQQLFESGGRQPTQGQLLLSAVLLPSSQEATLRQLSPLRRPHVSILKQGEMLDM